MDRPGLIFDLDGTLWDATQQIAMSNNITMSKFPEIVKNVTMEEMRGFMGKTIQEIARLVFPDMDEEKRQLIEKTCCDDEIEYFRQHGGRLYDGLEESLGEAGKKYRLFVVSNCQDGYLQACLDYHNLWGYFDDIEMAGRTGLSKSGNIRLIMERNGVDRAAYIGDTQSDMDAAVEAGVYFIHAAYGFGEVPEAEHKMNSITELTARADEIFGL